LRRVRAFWPESTALGFPGDKKQGCDTQALRNCKKSMIPLLEGLKHTSKSAKEYLAFLKTEGSDMFYGAPVLIIIFGNKRAPTAVYDCAMAAQT